MLMEASRHGGACRDAVVCAVLQEEIGEPRAGDPTPTEQSNGRINEFTKSHFLACWYCLLIR